MVSAHDVAEELRKRIPGLGALALHKLLYYVQGWSVAWTGSTAFEERIEAWEKGPVVADLWRAEKHGHETHSTAKLSKDTYSVVAYVASRYGGLSGADLMRLTHQEAPWIDASSKSEGDSEITFESLKDFFGSSEQKSRVDKVLEFAFQDPEVLKRFDAAVERTEHDPGAETDIEEFRQRVLSNL